jgi:hypothetical protein
MAWLGGESAEGRPMTEAVEEALYRHRRPLLGEPSVASFDTTSLYFEGTVQRLGDEDVNDMTGEMSPFWSF